MTRRQHTRHPLDPTTERIRAGVIEAIKAGVSDYIVKPATREMVEKKLTAVWNKHRK